MVVSAVTLFFCSFFLDIVYSPYIKSNKLTSNHISKYNTGYYIPSTCTCTLYENHTALSYKMQISSLEYFG